MACVASETTQGAGVRRGRFGRLARRSVRRQQVGLEGYLYLAHRVSGVILAVYLFVHLYTLSAVLRGAQAFDAVMEAFENPVIKFFELLLVVTVLFHTLNGIRLLLIHFTPFRRSRTLAWGVAVLPVAVGIASIRLFLG